MSARLSAGGVVHAIARHGHKVALGLQGLDDADLLRRVHAGIDLHLLYLGPQRGIVQCGQVGAGQHRSIGTAHDTKPVRNGARGGGVVACDHYGRDARADPVAHCGLGLGAGWVDECDQAQQLQLVFYCVDVVGVGQSGVAAAGQGQHAQALGGELLCGGEDPGGVERCSAFGRPVIGAAGQYRFRRALGVGDKPACIAVEGGHALAVRIKGLLLHTGTGGIELGLVQAACVGSQRQRGLRRVSQPLAARLTVLVLGLERGVVAQCGSAQGLGMGGAGQRVAGHPAHAVGQQQLGVHAVLGQSAGLVRADGGDRAQRPHRRQAPHQRMHRHHAACTQGQQHRDYGRQRLGDGGHGQADGCEGHQQRCLAAQNAHHKDHRTDAQHRYRQALAIRREAQLQRRAAVAGVEQRGHLAQLRAHAGGHHQPACAAMGGGGALEGHVGAVAQRAHVFGCQGFGLLGHRDGLAREGRFIHLQLRNLDEPQVGRDLVARLQQHDVAGHQFSSGQDLHHAAAQHGGVGRRQLAQRRHGLVGAPGLHKADNGVEHHDDEDHQRVCDLTHQPRDDRCAQQHQHHEVLELVGQQTPPGAVLRCGQLVGAMGGAAALRRCGAAALRLVGVQACVRVDTMGLGDGLGRVQLRRGGWGHAGIGETGRTPSHQCATCGRAL